ncbi:hypothetical protein FBU30_004069 [Linnemannia zychae]|nr:hypothetical protein FBU30_004069 [Linnemannia zychae]
MQINLLRPAVLLGLVSAMCLGVPVVENPQTIIARLHPAVGNVTTPDGTVLSYRLFNNTKSVNATPTIFICGLGQVQTDWDTVIPHFTTKNPVLSFDNRGIGLSTIKNGTVVNLKNMADDVRVIAKHFGWSKVNLVGISMGSIISETFMAANYTDVDVNRLVLIAGNVRSDQNGPIIKEIGEWIKNFSSYPPPAAEWTQFIHRLMLACLTPDFIKTHPKQVKYFLRYIDQGVGRSFEGFMAQANRTDNFDFTESLKHFSDRGTKTLVLHGVLDVGIPVEAAREIHALIPGSEYVEYPDGGHVLFETDPQVIDVMKKFIAAGK